MKKFEYKPILNRYRVLESIIILVVVCILVKSAYIMVIDRSKWTDLNKHHVGRHGTITPVRGNIFSADGEILATSVPDFLVYMDYVVKDPNKKVQHDCQYKRDTLFKAKLDSMAMGLNRILPDKSAAWFKSRLLEGYRKRSRHWQIYPSHISYMDYKDILQLPFFCKGSNVSGLHVSPQNDIKKPFGTLAARTLGDMYAGKDSARSGLQYSFDSILRGTPGKYHTQKVRNYFIEVLDQTPQDGADITTTLDVKLQDYSEKVLKEKMKEIDAIDGVALLMEVETGDIKAIVNLSKYPDGQYRERRNIAVSNLMEPGSVFKSMSFLVALDDGKLHIDDRVDCCRGIRKMYGREMKDHSSYGVLTASQCLEQSSNIGVSSFIDKFYHSHPEQFVDGLYRMGVAEDLHLDIPGYVRPIIKRPKKDRTGKHWANWPATQLAWMSIGYATQVPPISVLSFYNGIANNGKMMRPRLVTCATRNGEIVHEYPVQVIREQMAKPSAIKDLQICLERVVRIGLGKRAGSKLFSSSGKTGTAQIWDKNGRTSGHLISFVGYFPSEKPKYSCMVCMTKGSGSASGGTMCGPVFKKISERAMMPYMVPSLEKARDSVHHHMPVPSYGNFNYTQFVLDALKYKYSCQDNISNYFIEPWGCIFPEAENIVMQPVGLEKAVMPDMSNVGVRDAVYVLGYLGLKVKVEGVGLVVGQSIPAGRSIKEGETVTLKLGCVPYKSLVEEREELYNMLHPSAVQKVDTQSVQPETIQQKVEPIHNKQIIR